MCIVFDTTAGFSPFLGKPTYLHLFLLEELCSLLVIIFLIFVRSLCSDNSILILDNTIYWKRANCTYLLARYTIQRLTECQYKPISERTNMTFGVHFNHMRMGGTYYVHHMMLLWPEFVAEGTAGLNFSACCALLTDEVNELGQNLDKYASCDTLVVMVHYRRNSKSEFLYSLCLIDWWSWWT